MTDRSVTAPPGQIRLNPRRVTGWCGIGMIVAILINGPISNAAGRVPSYWTADATHRFGAYLTNQHRLDAAILFFGLSNLIFIFAIGFFAGLRSLSEQIDPTGWLKGVITIGAGLFLAGGLLSETLSTGVTVVLRSTPAYHLEINTILLLQGLWATALAQGQVALGVVIATYSGVSLHTKTLPRWVASFGVFVGVLTIARLAVVTHTVLWIALLQPAFLWVALVAIAQLRETNRTRIRRSSLTRASRGQRDQFEIRRVIDELEKLVSKVRVGVHRGSDARACLRRERRSLPGA